MSAVFSDPAQADISTLNKINVCNFFELLDNSYHALPDENGLTQATTLNRSERPFATARPAACRALYAKTVRRIGPRQAS
jgi:hypothetical protein